MLLRASVRELSSGAVVGGEPGERQVRWEGEPW